MRVTFSYKARDTQGKLVKGKITSESQDEVAKELLKTNLTPVEITPLKKKSILSININILPQKVTPKELHLFCRQIYTMIKAGIPMTNALKRLSESTHNTKLSKALFDMYEQIAAGKNLASTMDRHKNVFPALMRHVVGVGEETGRLDEAFLQIGDYISLELKTMDRIKSIMRYPIIVIIAISVAITVVNIFVIPAFENLFSSFKAELPIFTRILVNTSNFFVTFWWLILIFVVGTIIGLRKLVKTPYGKLFWHRLQLKIPIFGKTLEKILLARFSRTFLMVLRTGISITEGVELVGNSLGNEYFRKKAVEIRQLMEKGQSFAVSAKATKVFPSLALQMMMIGEDSGEMDKMVEQVAEFYDREIDYEIDKLGDLIEPVLLVFVGALVLMLALGVFLPIWELGAVAQKG